MKQTMKSCILEQPDTIRRVCQNAEKVCDSVYSIVGKGPFDKIYLIGSGTSLHTAIAAKYAFTKWFNAEVQVFTPFDFLYYYPHYRLDEKTLILGISQTARSIGTIHCLEKGREYGARTVMVTAEPDNPGGKSAEAILDTCTGEELVGAKTKGFTSTIAMLYLYAAGLAGKELDISLVPKWMEQSLRCTSEEIEDFAEEYKSAPSVTIIGGGTLTAAAKEGALKVLEGVRIPVEVYDVEEYMHGPYHCLEKWSYLIFLVNEGPGVERIKRMIQFAQEHSDHVTVIGYEGFEKEIEIKGRFISLPGGMDEILTPLLERIPFLLPDLDTVREKLANPNAEGFAINTKLYEENGIKLLAQNSGLQRHIFSTDKLIKVPKDLANETFRTYEDAIVNEFYGGLGNIAIMPYGELYTSLQNGLITATDQQIPSYIIENYYEVAPFYSYVGAQWTSYSLMMNLDKFNQYSEEDQKIFVDAAWACSEAEYESYKDMKADAEKFFDEKGITYYQPTDEELNQWKEYAASLSDKWRELIGEELYNQVSELFNY